MSERPEATVLLTTHYMAEADEMCDRLAIIDKGRVQACDTPAALKKMVQKEIALKLSIAGVGSIPEEWRRAPGVSSLTTEIDSTTQMTTLHALLVDSNAGGSLIRAVAESGRRLLDLKNLEPTLEDVFIKLTGRRLGEEEKEDEELGD
jgi:ABC-2 type transport system ATP-binding protein